MTLSPQTIETSTDGVTFTRRRPRVRALMAILVLCALAASSGAAVLVPVDASVEHRASYERGAREYRQAAAKSAAKSGATRRDATPDKQVTSDPC